MGGTSSRTPFCRARYALRRRPGRGEGEGRSGQIRDIDFPVVPEFLHGNGPCNDVSARVCMVVGMSKRLVNMRVDTGLLGRVDAEAERLGQTRTLFVVRALESALGGSSVGQSGGDDPRVVGSTPARPAPSRAPVRTIEHPGGTKDYVDAAGGVVSSSAPGGRPLSSAADLMWERQQRLNKKRDKS